MAIQTISTAYNPISGVFGTGQVQMYFASGTWSVPPGIGKVRARVWGGGGHNTAGAGGFSLITIYSLVGVTSVAVTVGAGGISGATTGGTSSFGAYCSATGGTAGSGGAGVGTGGDINYSGGLGGGGSGAGSASIFGNGGRPTSFKTVSTGGAGGGGSQNPASGVDVPIIPGGNGFLGVGGILGAQVATFIAMPTSGLEQFSIDFIGAGGGAGVGQNGINGGGGAGNGGGYGYASHGGIPGGGGGPATTANNGNGGQGLVIVEW